MYDGYLAIGTVEVLNRARAAAYVSAFLPLIEVRCADAGLAEALGHSDYTTPEDDSAPWFTGRRVAGAGFLGLFPGKVEGAEDSTRKMQVTELTGNGAVLTSARSGAKEMRFVATAFALNEESMQEGMAWLRDVLSHDGCSGAQVGCLGRDAKFFAAAPVDQLSAYTLSRTFYRAEVTEGPLVTKKFNSKQATIWEIEFTLTAGIPWAFTSRSNVGTLNMDDALNFQDPVGENCAVLANPYDQFVADPFFTGISRPPRPPVILPPNVLNITSWRRLSLPIPAANTQRWGRTVPVVQVLTENAIQYLRLRFYEDGASGCDFAGEVLISYIPATAVLTLNALTREVSLELPDGKVVPAGHLLFGSSGAPMLWPELGCQKNYTMTADLMPGQAGAVVVLDTSVRE